jgi:hypothetical protein
MDYRIGGWCIVVASALQHELSQVSNCQNFTHFSTS